MTGRAPASGGPAPDRSGLLAALAVALFAPLFLTGGIGRFDFWWWLTSNVALLVGLAALLDPSFVPHVRADLRDRWGWKVLGGLGSAAVLYGVFYVAGIVSTWMLPFAEEGIASVYAYREQASVWRIAVLLGLVIGPGEELFWRVFLQRRLGARFGAWSGFGIMALLYGGVHLFSGNLMLAAAAMVCGLIWGWLYLRYRSALLNMVSHTVWDLAVFLLFPLTTVPSG